LGSSLAEDADKIVWTVNGVPNTPSDTYPVTTTMNVTVVAVAVAPDVLEFDWENPAPFAFTVAGGCDLETLALTGPGSSGWALNAGIGVLVLGAGMMLMRRREESLFD
jgi:LPXTG-motif cell wall-anchored protein